MPAPFRLTELFTPNARTNLAAFMAQHNPAFADVTGGRNGFMRGKHPMPDREFMDTFMGNMFGATASVREEILSKAFGH